MGYTFKPAEDVIQADPIPQEQPEEENACQASVFRNEELGQSMAIAQLKLALIMPAYQNLHDKKSNKAYFEDLAQHEIRMPDGSARRFKAKTFEAEHSRLSRSLSSAIYRSLYRPLDFSLRIRLCASAFAAE